ncbi:unnamed protein product [Rodentolepis nana]|uniref:RNase H domain-containing protein n=1 Tax=Rodentolepis nana TaxID=102285 RepID=A0A158QJ83_RODNA|nr:unnamed protein product [Rodentolepis nana]
MAHHSINPLPRYKDTTLENTNELTYLGMTFDTKLTWKSHIAKIAERVSNRLNVLKRLAGSVWGCARSTLNTTYKMFIQLIMLYCCEPLITATEVTLKPLEKAYNLALRLITGGSTTIGSLIKEKALILKSNTPPEQMRSLALETINANYPADQWLQVFTDGSYIESQANVGAGVYSELFSFYAAAGHNRSAFEGEIEVWLMQQLNLDEYTINESMFLPPVEYAITQQEVASEPT